LGLGLDLMTATPHIAANLLPSVETGTMGDKTGGADRGKACRTGFSLSIALLDGALRA